MKPKISDVLGTVLDNLNEDTWIQRNFHVDEKHCALGHIGIAINNYRETGYNRYEDVRNYMQNVCKETRGTGIMCFNDTDGTSVEDVTMLFKEGYVKALEEGV